MSLNNESSKIPTIGVIVTIYNAEAVISELVSQITQSLSNIDDNYRVLFIDDGSKDSSWIELKRNCEFNSKLKAIKFSRNFGQHTALSAGLQILDAKYIVIMDGDLQESPDNIRLLYDRITKADCDIVFAKRSDRKDGVIKIQVSKLFYTVFSRISGINTDSTIGTFRIMKQKVALAFREFTERNKYIGGIFNWMGFDCEVIPVEHFERKYGKSSYNIRKLLKLAGLGIISFSNKPLNFAIYVGFISSFLSIIGGIYFGAKKLFYGINVTGYSSLIVSIYFIGGMILFVLGIIGQYIGQIYDQTKNRPEYIISKKINLDE